MRLLIWHASAAPRNHSDAWVREYLAASFSPDGRRGLTASVDATARLWDLGTGRPIGPPMPNAAPVTSAVFSRDGARVLTADDSGEARVWDAATATPIGPRQEVGRRRRLGSSPGQDKVDGLAGRPGLGRRSRAGRAGHMVGRGTRRLARFLEGGQCCARSDDHSVLARFGPTRRGIVGGCSWPSGGQITEMMPHLALI